MEIKSCPWCAEDIAAAALKCRYCGSRVEGGLRDLGNWHRDYPDRKLAGVCASVAQNMGIPVTAVRAGFILMSLFHALGLALYGILWFVLPQRPGGPTGLDRAIEAWRTLVGRAEAASQGGSIRRSGARGRSHRDAAGEDRSGGWDPTRS